jgi:hypothetical protein
MLRGFFDESAYGHGIKFLPVGMKLVENGIASVVGVLCGLVRRVDGFLASHPARCKGKTAFGIKGRSTKHGGTQ